VLQECYDSVTRVLRKCYESLTLKFIAQQGSSDTAALVPERVRAHHDGSLEVDCAPIEARIYRLQLLDQQLVHHLCECVCVCVDAFVCVCVSLCVCMCNLLEL
jgi:hypothetical protein